jgi:CRP/FNR family cyclic AMP-dependent transcriptional regulator
MALAGGRCALHALAMASRDLSAALASTWFTAGLSGEERGRLAVLGRLVTIPEGTIVVQEGTPCTSLGVVVSGRVAIRLRLPGGEDRTILTVDPGDIFGWSAIVPPAVATSTVVTLLPTKAVMFDGDRMRRALASDCTLAASIYQRLLVSVVRRLGATRTQLLDLYRPGAEPW